MISKATLLTLVALAALSTAQDTAWDGSTRPRMQSEAGNLNLHTHDDVTVHYRGHNVTSSLFGIVQGQENLQAGQESLQTAQALLQEAIRQIRTDMRE